MGRHRLSWRNALRAYRPAATRMAAPADEWLPAAAGLAVVLAYALFLLFKLAA